MNLDHPTKNDVTSGKKSELSGKIKFQYGIIVLSVSQMLIFRNQSGIFNVLFGHDKQNFVLFLVISVFLKNRAVVISSSLNSTGLIVCLEIMNSR